MSIKSGTKSLLGLAAAATLLLTACGEQTSAPEPTAVATPAAVEQSPGYRRINSPNPEDPLAAQIYELDNGLQIFLTENHEEPRFYAEIAVRAGSKHDPADGTGLAHYLEHMLFMGSTKYPIENQYDSFLSKHSGSDNAYTECEHTVYYLTYLVSSK